MAVNAASVTVATTVTQLTTTDPGYGGTGTHPDGQSIVIKVPAGGQVVYLGGPAVTSASGYPLAAGESFTADLAPGDVLFGIVAATTQVVNVLRTGV